MRIFGARFVFPAVLAALLGFGSIGAASSMQDRSAQGPIRRGEHVVVVVWDGMRPDFVNEQNTPALWKLAHSGVTFRNHHSVFPSATIVNGTAINTGVYPDRSGVLANHDYRPEIDAKRSIDVENMRVVRKGDELSGGKYIALPTIAELIRNGGGKTAIATAKTVGLLFDRHADPRSGQNIFAGDSAPPEAITEIVKTLGTFPPATRPADRDAWTTKALTDFLWEKGIPLFSLLWLSEPDDTEHKTAPGAPAAVAAIKSTDHNLARVLAALDQHQAGSTTDIFVVSDHGFSTIARSIDIPKLLRDAGFDAVTEFTSEPKPGQIMIVGNGGTILFYVVGHEAAVTRGPTEGTFTLDKAKIDNKHAPDVEMSFRWTDDKNQFGAAGMIEADWQRAAGKGTHATLSKFDMHNMLIAAGPDFRRAETDELPSGNVDLAPTVLQILGIKSPTPMDGRVLSEAMTDAQSLKPEKQTIEASKKFSAGMWRQHLTILQVGSTVYFEEGNGGFKR